MTDGDFVVTWTGRGGSADGTGDGIAAQIFHSDGSALAGSFQVNTTAAGNQSFSDVAALSNGEFVVVWQSSPNIGGTTIYGQVYQSTGVADGGEFVVNTFTGSMTRPSVTALDNGKFVVSWNDGSQTMGDTNAAIHSRIFDTGASDTTPPDVSEGLKNDTGFLGNDKITSDATLTGSGDSRCDCDFHRGQHDSRHNACRQRRQLELQLRAKHSDGSHTIVASETDAANNTGTESLTFTLDTAMVTVAGPSVQNQVGGAVTLTGTGEADESVVIHWGDGSPDSGAAADNSGVWTAQRLLCRGRPLSPSPRPKPMSPAIKAAGIRFW